MKNTVTIKRETRETNIDMTLVRTQTGCGLEGTTGIGFFDHMLNSFAVHGGFSIKLNMTGDLNVDGHHTVEDVGIVLGKLLSELCEDKSGIKRYGQAAIPMDESLAYAVIDVSGRPFLVFDVPFTAPKIGDYDTQLTLEFFRALAFNMGATLHINLVYGVNDHHKVEACFKAVAHALSDAISEAGNGAVLSAKGVL